MYETPVWVSASCLLLLVVVHHDRHVFLFVSNTTVQSKAWFENSVGGPESRFGPFACPPPFVVTFAADFPTTGSLEIFQIALNGLDQYSGGGTFFPCLGRSLRPPEGHTLSFRGDILHGGDPLLKGVRYIIACFCYYDDDDADGGGGEGAQKGESRRVCGTSAMDRRARGYSSGGGGSDVNGSGSGSGSAAERNGASGGGADDVAEGGKGIEFRSDEAFSFGFGFG